MADTLLFIVERGDKQTKEVWDETPRKTFSDHTLKFHCSLKLLGATAPSS